MDGWLKQNTAVTIKYGPFVSSTDGFTPCPSTGDVALATSEVRLAKNGGDFAAKASATTSVYDEYGYFNVALSTGDVGTAGLLIVAGVTTAAYFAVPQTYMVLPDNVHGSLVGGTDLLDVNVAQLLGGTSSADDIVTMVAKVPSKAYLTGTTNADGDIDASQVVGNVAANIIQVTTNSTAAADLVTLGSKLPSYSYLAGSTSPTGEITATVAGAVTLTTGAEDSLVDKTWDELILSHATTATMGDAINRITSGYILADMVRISGGTSAADNLESYTNGTTYMPVNAIQVASATPIDAAAMADAVCDEALAGHVSTGTVGDALGRLDEISTGIATVEAKLPSKTYLTGSSNADGDFDASEVIGNFGGSVASVAGAVASVSGAVGSVTGAVGSVTAAVTLSTASADTVVAGTWGALLTSYASTGTMGDAVNRLNEISTGITTIEAKLPSKSYLTGSSNADGDIDAAEIAGNFAGSVGSVVGAVGSVTGAVGSVTGAVGSVTAGVTLTTGAEDSVFGYAYESTETFGDYLRVSRSALYGTSTGGGTATATFYDMLAEKARITATVTTDGNRTAVTVDGSTT